MANILPSKTKYRKVQKGRNRGKAKGGDRLAFGEFGLQCLERGKITASQLEATRVAITRNQKRKGKVWMRVFPHKPVTKKPAETRMGSGKGNPEFWVAVVRPGRAIIARPPDLALRCGVYHRCLVLAGCRHRDTSPLLLRCA